MIKFRKKKLVNNGITKHLKEEKEAVETQRISQSNNQYYILRKIAPDTTL